MPLADYELAAITAIRAHNTRLNRMDNDALRNLYREWSEKTAAAGWCGHNAESIRSFIEWATTAPCDRLHN